jgi:hypothetical protein
VTTGSNPYIYQGTPSPNETFTFTKVNQALSLPAAGFDIYGVDPTKFATVCLHKNRLWFAEYGTANAWYLDPQTLGGEAKKWPLGGIFSKGGALQCIATWTIDAGSGIDDYIVFISQQGQVAIYGGEVVDTDWQLQGVYDLGSPIGLKATTKYGGDLLVITTDGLVPLSKAMQSTRVNNSVALTDKIQYLISELVTRYKGYVGWQVLVFPNENQIWLVTPPVTSTLLGTDNNDPHVSVLSMSTITGAWAEYSGMDIRDVCLFDDTPLFGTKDGYIGLAWQGTLDDTEWGGAPVRGKYIEAEVLTAYNYFGDQARNKRWTLARLIFQSGVVPAANIRISTDFALLEKPEEPSDPTVPSSTPLWGLALWGTDRWPESPSRYRQWITVNGIGYCAALNMRVRSATSLLWTASDFAFEVGGVV